MPDLNQLHDQHVNLAALGRHLSAIIAQDTPPPSRELYVLRMEFASALIRHLKMEDWTLYPRLLASSNDRVALTSRAFNAEMGGLAKEFGNYANRWGTNAIERDWEGYQRETAEILRTLMLRIAREERDLYPLLEALGDRRIAAHHPSSAPRPEPIDEIPHQLLSVHILPKSDILAIEPGSGESTVSLDSRAPHRELRAAAEPWRTLSDGVLQ